MTDATDAPPPPAGPTFADLGLPEPLLKALSAIGYEAPSPIQAQTIPTLLAGKDVLGMAQTGTGKTAAFALPILARIDLKQSAPQALVLAPTRELAIQVAEAFQKYAAHLKGFHVLPIYGGQSYQPQLSALRRGAHVIVGTPGRVIDHMERGTLRMDGLRFVVLDEADEMLRMGFIDDVDKILQQTPVSRQVALFSATMPAQIRRIAQRHLKNPSEITVREKTATVANTRQRYWLNVGATKLEALTRILEAEPFDAMIVFVRTKQDTIELSTRLEARGFASAPLNGDIDQRTRERTVLRLKGGTLDIVVATDVAARGLDVERITHVVNFDVPTDTESYVHRIGRTGRAGRKGEAILFIQPRERHMLKLIERATRQSLQPMDLPSADAVLAQRMGKLKEKLAGVMANPKLAETLSLYRDQLVGWGLPPEELAAALAYLLQGDAPGAAGAPGAAMTVTPSGATAVTPSSAMAVTPSSAMAVTPSAARGIVPGTPRRDAAMPRATGKAPAERTPKRAEGMETFRIEVGEQHGVKPGNIVGAIANEAELDAQHIGRVQIFDDHSLVDLPEGMPKQIFKHLQKVWVCGQQLKLSRLRK